MLDKDTAKEEIRKLVEKYNRLVESGKLKSYNEEMTKKDFILPLFRALGWSVEDGEEVTAEEKVSRGRVDYAFRIEGIPKLFLEAKALKIDLDKVEFAEQAINYAWHKGAMWAVLTDFEGIKVFNAEWKSQNPLQNMFFGITCFQFLDKFEQLWLLSRESLEKGLIDKEAEKWGKKAKKIPVDKQLLTDMTKFRELLNKNILKNNSEKELSSDELDEVVQRLLDRLLFIRTLEDRQLEAPVLQALIREDTHKKVYKKLNDLFRKIDDIYNSKLFRPHLCEELILDDDLLEKIIKGLFRTSDNIVHYDFGAIDADVLGNMYEQYLGHILKKTAKRAKLTSGKTHRKEQGIYYTPTYVVDYIVKNTIGELAKNKKFNLKKIKVLDPACGSGSFLMKAFDYLVTLDKKKNGDIDQTKLDLTGVSITYGRKIEILKNNIFGVDLDPKAVEIAQLNLLLKAAEKKHRLPTLQENIKVGNSLIDNPEVAGKRAFKWEEEFKEIMDNGGFDVVIGNPPYGALFEKSEKEYFREKFITTSRVIDSYILFIEKASTLLKEHGLLSFIVPESWLTNPSNKNLRKYLINNFLIKKIVDLPGMVFPDATVDTIILVIEKKDSKKNLVELEVSQVKGNLNIIKKTKILQNKFLYLRDYSMNTQFNDEIIDLIKKIEKNSINLKSICKNTRGIETGDNKKYLRKTKETEEYLPMITGDDILRYTRSGNKYYVKYGEELSNPKSLSLFKRQKIVLQRIKNQNLKRRLVCTIDEEDRLILDSVHMIFDISKNYNTYYILALINSKLLNFYFKLFSLYPRINADDLDYLQIKEISLNNQAKFADKAKKMFFLNKRLLELKLKTTDEKAQIEKEIQKLDNEIDQEVYKLYGLTKQEINIIEDSLKN